MEPEEHLLLAWRIIHWIVMFVCVPLFVLLIVSLIYVGVSSAPLPHPSQHRQQEY